MRIIKKYSNARKRNDKQYIMKIHYLLVMRAATKLP